MNRFKFPAVQLIFILMASIGSVAFAQPAITSFTPGSGSIGTLISISGAALSNPTAFSIGGKEAIVISNDGNKLVGMVMPGATTGNISITNEGGTTNSAGNFTVIPSLLPVSQQGSKLIGTGGVGRSAQGSSVSLSADGNTAIVGGFQENGDVGAVWIYTRSGSTWTQQGNKLVGTGGIGISQQGSSVSLSADGNTAAVCGSSDNKGIGAVWVFTRTGSTWTQQGSKLVGTDDDGSSLQSRIVKISADGNTILTGGSWGNNNIGTAWIYARINNTWTQQGSKLVGTDYVGNNSYQGCSVSLDNNGNTAIVGGYGDDSNVGAAWIYTRSNGTWTQQGTKLVGTGNAGITGQGRSVSLSGDGNIAIVCALNSAWTFTRSGDTWTQLGSKMVGIVPSGSIVVSLSNDGNKAIVAGNKVDVNRSTGDAWIYSRSGSTWTQGSKLIGTDIVGSSFPGVVSVSLSADGNTAIIGCIWDNNFSGASWIFVSEGGWKQQGPKLVGTGVAGTSAQGSSVSLSADGNTAIVGGRSDNGGIGASWIYTRNGGIWTQKGSKLVGTEYLGSPYQGSSVSLSADGNTAIVGGPWDDNGFGAAWTFARSGNTWTQLGSKLIGYGSSRGSQIGSSVSLSADGNTAIIGGWCDNSNIGAAWIYTRSGGYWVQQGNKLVGTGGVGTSYQGSSVSLSADGNSAIVGGSSDNSGIGAAWIYTRNGGTWTQQGTKLVGTGNIFSSAQGSSASLSADGNTAIVGGSTDNWNIGAVWIYTRSGSTWSQQGSKLIATDYTGTPLQGKSVSLSADGNTAIVSGGNDYGGIGAAWIYTRSGNTWTQQGSKFGGIDYTGTSYQGSSVSISADGNTALTGGPGDNNGVGAAWVFSTLITSTTIEFVDLQKDLITIYPNPAGGSIIISGLSLITNDKDVSLMLTGISGKTTLLKRLERNTSFEIIDISSFANGAYFLILQTDKERIVKSFIKQ